MNILDKIVAVKRKEIELAKSRISHKQLENSPAFNRPTNSLKSALQQPASSGIIAEFKKASPSKGIINDSVRVEDIVTAYSTYGAAGVSVLTDEEFFKGSLNDLERARKVIPNTPLLRKDFVVEEYQLLQAKHAGADLILLIAACLSPAEVKQLAEFAKNLQLEVLLEIHNEDELGHVNDSIDLVGVNNRDLKSFVVDVNRSKELAEKIPASIIKISESGISSVDTIRDLKTYGYKGFLMGENFMKETDPAIAFARFIEKLQTPVS